MTTRLRMVVCGLAVLAAVALPSTANAVLIDYTIQIGNDNGFGFSWIHGATNAVTKNGVTFYTSGDTMFKLTGSITGEWNTVAETLTWNAGDLTAEVFNAGNVTSRFAGSDVSGDWTLSITGGSVARSGSFAEGTIVYSLKDASDVEQDTGTFHIFPEDFAGPATSITADGLQFSLWANNWENDVMTRADFSSSNGTPLGIDIRGDGTVIPTPAAAVLAMLGIGATRRLRRRSARG